ncbi:MAG: choice-of-anchor J domain-containing protein [Muribaculaceae bacterium]|nr:choice-of-anchor J domain-containing protein [Muribaculaceae bacterium]
MKSFSKSLLRILAGGAVICAGYIGISAKTVVSDFMKKQDKHTEIANSVEQFRTPHRTHSEKRGAVPKSVIKSDTNSTQSFQCVMTYLDDWDSYGEEPGVYTFDSTTPISFKSTFVSDEYTPSGGGFFTDKYYFLTSISEDWFTGEIEVYTYKFSRGDWEELNYASKDIYSLYNCVCYDQIEDRAYGYFYSDEGGDWGYMDINTMRVTHVAPMLFELVAVAINDQGKVYGIGADGAFYSINKANGEGTKIGATGLSPQYMQSAAFGLDGNLYWGASEADSSGLYTIDLSTGKASFVGAFPGTEEISALYAVYNPASIRVPAQATDLKADVSGISLSFPFSFKVPAKTYNGNAMSGEVSYIVYIDGDAVANGNANTGSEVSVSLTVNNPGYHLFKVVLVNAEGESEPATIRSWIGVDQPKAVRNAKLEKTGDNTLNISWEAPAGGVNNGYFDASMLTYTVVRLPENKVVAENIKATTFTDSVDIKEGQSLIRYTIYAVADGLEGIPTVTPGIVMGKPYQVPVEFTFDSQEDYNIFTVIDNNETVTLDSGLWEYTPSGEAAGYVGGTKDGDDWLITPSVYLKARTQYSFSHDVLCYSDTWPEEYSVYIGTSPDSESMTRQIVSSTTIWWDEYRTNTQTITVDKDGVYYFGFHATSEAGSAFFLLDNIKIDMLYSIDAPAVVSDLSVVAGDKGTKSATITFTTPSKSVGDEDLDEDLTVKILRNGVVIETQYDVAPDEKIAYEDNSPVNNSMNTYEVICSTYYGAGPGLSAEVWVGLDSPSAPEEATVTLDASGHPVISWKAPTGRGVHGGYVDNSALTYTVASVKNGSLIPVAQNIAALTCTDNDTVLTNAGAQAMHQYYIVPTSNATGEYGENASALYISGKPYALPFKESFAGNKATNFWAFTNTNGEGWYIGDDWSIGSQDDDDGMLSYLPAVPEVTTTAMSGKIDVSAAENPKLTFYLRKMDISDNGYYDTDPSKDVLNIKAGVDGFTLKTVESIRLEDVKKTGTYIYYSIPLADLNAKDFIVIAFEYEAVSDRTPIMIDNIQVKDPRAYNAIAGEVIAPEAVEVFDTFELSASVYNVGDNELKDVKVQLMRDDNVEAEATVSTIAPDQSAVVTLEVSATPAWGDEAELTVRVVADNDEVEADNSSEPFKIKVIYHECPAVNDLKGDINGDKLTLTWSEPEGLKQLETKVTESFESYNHGDLTFGGWKSEDKSFWGFDGIKTITVDGKVLQIPNSDEAQAFMIFNPTQAGIDLDDNPEWEPVSGHNLIVSFGDAANDDMEANNDWLISPELSGKAQTISFWARTGAKKGKPDDIRVLLATDIEYNNNGTVKSSCFTALPNGDINLTREWVKYEFTLPAGTKYFAIRNLSDDGFAVLIDDITYEPYAEKTYANLKGYNIYFDGSQINTEIVTETTYTVNPYSVGKYTVRTVYDEGESEDSNVVDIATVAVFELGTDDMESVYYDLNGFKITNPESGKVYIRRKGNTSEKVLIKR